MTLYHEIPSLDLADFLSGDHEKKATFVQQLGFVAIKNHGLSDKPTADLYQLFEAFFALENTTKQLYNIPKLHGQRGYVGKGKKHAKGSNVGDPKEFFHIGQIVQDPIAHEIIHVGDMLERLTNNRLKSTIHRVVNPPKDKMNTPRYSISFFMHPRISMDLTCLPQCIDAQNPKKYSYILEGDFLMQRLQEIGRIKK